MQARLNETTAVVHKLFGKTHEEACKQLNVKQLEQSPREYPWGVHQTGHADSSVTISVGFNKYYPIIQFTLAYYPSCCGSMMFHTFKVDEHRVNQDQLDEIMNTFVRENRDTCLGKNARIEVMMVESRRIDVDPRNPLQEPAPVENPKMTYKTLWNFFHKYSKRVRTRLEVNANTGNVLHNMEVIL